MLLDIIEELKFTVHGVVGAALGNGGPATCFCAADDYCQWKFRYLYVKSISMNFMITMWCWLRVIC